MTAAESAKFRLSLILAGLFMVRSVGRREEPKLPVGVEDKVGFIEAKKKIQTRLSSSNLGGTRRELGSPMEGF